MPHERAILLVKRDFSYSCAAADKISTDLRARVLSSAAELRVKFLDPKHKFWTCEARQIKLNISVQ